MKAPFFWTPGKITLVIFLFSLFVLALIVYFFFIGAVEFFSGGGQIK